MQADRRRRADVERLLAARLHDAHELGGPPGQRRADPLPFVPQHPGARPGQLGAVQEIARHKVAYLMAVGGAAYLVARAIKEARVVGFEDLGMEAIYEFTVKDMPVTVAVDAEGNNVHTLAPAHWRDKIAREGLLEGA